MPRKIAPARIKTYATHTVLIDSITPHSRNTEYHAHPDVQVEMLAQSAQTFGQYKNVVVWKKKIIAGAGIWAGLKRAGASEIEIKDVSHLSETQAFALMTADNETQKGAITNDAALAALVREVMDKEGEAVARLAAGEQKALDALLAQTNKKEDTADIGELVDKAAELQKKWQVQCGDVWQIGKHRLMCGDSTNAKDVKSLMRGDTLQLFVTDAPYGVSYADKNKYLNAVAKGNSIQTPIENDHLNAVERDVIWLNAFKTANDSSVAGCPCYFFMPQGGEQMMMMMMMMQAGWIIQQEIIWVKNNHVLGRSDYQYKHEPIAYGWKKGAHKFFGNRSQFSVLEYPKPHNSDAHPTTKPIELVAHLIRNSSEANTIVGDWFVGSGTTLVACEQTGRIGRGMEIEPKYVAVSLERLLLLGLEPKRIESVTHGKQEKIGANTEKSGRQARQKSRVARQSAAAMA